MPLLYKYLPPDNAKDGTPRPLLILRTMRLSVTDPRDFNDPFEVRPWFDQERHDHYARSHESFYQRALGIRHTLIRGRSMVGLPTEHAASFGEHLNKRFRDDLGRKYRVLCLSRNQKSVLMWGHYTRSHSGIVIGIDTSAPGFAQGLKPKGFKVQYSRDRSRTKLPLAFYQSPQVEAWDLQGNLVNRPDEEVISDSGLVIPFREYRRQVEAAGITALTTKANDWRYEREVRYVYDLAQHRSQLVCEEGRHFLPIPPKALREIIVGFRADPELVREIVRLFRDGRIGQPKLFFSECHPYLYQVEAHKCDDSYLLDYFAIIRPTL